MKNELNGKLVTVDEEIKNLEGHRLQPQKGFYYPWFVRLIYIWGRHSWIERAKDKIFETEVVGEAKDSGTEVLKTSARGKRTKGARRQRITRGGWRKGAS